MNDDKEKWIKDVFQSMKGSQRAKPNSNLFLKIQNRIRVEKTKMVTLNQWRYAEVAAILILVMNSAALMCFSHQNKGNKETAVFAETYDPALINSFQIYE